MLNRGADNVLDDCKTGSTKLVNIVDMLHMFPFAQQGGGGADNVLDDCKTWSTEFVAVVDMFYMLAYAQQRGLITFLTIVRQGPRNLLPLLACCTCSLMLNRGLDNVLDDCKTGSTKLFAVVDMLHMFPYAQQRGLITFLTTVKQGRRNLLPFLACCHARLCSTGGLITFLTTV